MTTSWTGIPIEIFSLIITAMMMKSCCMPCTMLGEFYSTFTWFIWETLVTLIYMRELVLKQVMKFGQDHLAKDSHPENLILEVALLIMTVPHCFVKKWKSDNAALLLNRKSRSEGSDFGPATLKIHLSKPMPDILDIPREHIYVCLSLMEKKNHILWFQIISKTIGSGIETLVREVQQVGDAECIDAQHLLHIRNILLEITKSPLFP